MNRTPLHFAVTDVSYSDLEDLVNCGGDLYSTDVNGHTPLDLAERSISQRLFKHCFQSSARISSGTIDK